MRPDQSKQSKAEFSEKAKETLAKLHPNNIMEEVNDIKAKASALPRKGRNRNKPCPCGSGIKYKKCHW